MAAKEQEFEPIDKGILEAQFETLFDGDEINGKFYAKGDIVTGLDAATAHYLENSVGRIQRVSDDRIAALKEAQAAEKRERRREG